MGIWEFHARSTSQQGLLHYYALSERSNWLVVNHPPLARPPLKGDPAAAADHLLGLSPDALVVSSTQGDTLAPLGYLGIFPALVTHPGFSAYELSYTASVDPDQGYFVYRRR